VEETRFGKMGRMGRALGRPILERWKTKIESGGDAKIIWARIDFGPRIEIENVFLILSQGIGIQIKRFRYFEIEFEPEPNYDKLK
jgi:hypothetical protein